MSNNQTPTTPGGPLSFKTVPGRHRTQKWNTAPKNTYDGDDWGDYDPYDDYGGGQEEPASTLPAQSSALPSQRLRKQSFDRGDDGAASRTVSAPFPSYPQDPVSGGRASNDYPRSRSRPRDFTNPEHAPPPLHSQRGAAPAPPGSFPPRKSSMGGNTYEAQQAAAEARAIAESVTHPAVNTGAATAADAQTDKALPFIRPSDIYRRVEEERRRESEESSRPSVDALDRAISVERRNDLTPLQEQRESVLYPNTYQPNVTEKSGNEQTLHSVQSASSTISGTRDVSPTLPLVSRFSGFGDEFLNLTSPTATGDVALPSRASPPGINTAGLTGADTASSSIQPTPTSTRAPPGSDPAAEILAERQQVDGLQHQPSVGLRSAVHQAFDKNDASLSRDNSGSTPSMGVGRSDTSSTAGISPIMSRVPSAATAAFNQRQRDIQVPPITEEPLSTPTAAQPVDTTSPKTTPAGFEPGYRRSLDPPSSGTSPARTPGLETVESRRLSTPLSGVIAADDPEVADQGAEVVQPDLQPAETSDSEVAEMGSASAVSTAIPITGRGRSNTDYSVREADIANTINSSAEKDPGSPELAEAAQESKDSRETFLRTHNLPTSSPVRSGTPTRSDSPAKSRVREIAEKYQGIHDDSRRNSAASIGSSKSGWSTFTDDANKPKLKKAATNQSLLAQEVAPTGQAPQGLGVSRPDISREESFLPDVPGGWINSAAPTPSVETPPEVSARDISRDDGPIDLTPTARKKVVQPETITRSPIETAKDMGNQLGAALMGQYGVGHETRDFASKEAPASIDQAEMLPRRAYGEVPAAPPLIRHETDSTDAPTSVASSAAPTPLPKNAPEPSTPTNAHGSLGPGYFNSVAPLRLRSREASPEHATPQAAAQYPHHGPGDSAEDDRIREEIVRSLDADDAVRTQDALNAPDNERRVEHGEAAFPAAAAGAVGLGAAAATVAAAAHSKTSHTKPGLLNTRFSWESNALPSREQPISPEIKPEAAYERPRSKQLHVMNPEDGANSPDTPALEDKLPELSATAGGPLLVPAIQRPEAAAAEGEIVRSLSQRVKSPVSPITKSQEHLVPETTNAPGSPSQSLHDVAPSPVSDGSLRVPSYYADSNQEIPNAASIAPGTSPTLAATSPSRPKSSGQSQVQIPAFRNILQIKDADERIKTYTDTRRTFADMNTGLGDWLEAMTARHPDVLDAAEMGKPPPLEPSVSASGTNQWKRGHRAAAPSMNLTGLKNRFTSASSAQGSNQGQNVSNGGAAPSGLASSDTAGGSGGVDLDRVQQQMQQKGKVFMKNAGVLGNKAGAGAKGLLAKGRSRFGGSVRGKGGEVPATSTAKSISPFSKLRAVSSRTSSAVAPLAQPASPSTNRQPSTGIVTNPHFPSAGPEVEETVLPEKEAIAESSSIQVHKDKASIEDDARGCDIADVQPRIVEGEPHVTIGADETPGTKDRTTTSTKDSSGLDDPRDEIDQHASQAVPVATVVTALAAQISDLDSKSEAVRELQEAAPIVAEMNLPEQDAVDAGNHEQASVSAGPKEIVESMHVSPTGLQIDNADSVINSSERKLEEITTPPATGRDSPPSSTLPGIPIPPGHDRSFSEAAIIPLNGSILAPVSAPISASPFENRPDLSRKTSAASSTLAFRRREGSATPSSRSSRPLSDVFDRLRGWSRSRAERSQSRPDSLVLSRSNLLSDECLQTSVGDQSQTARAIKGDKVKEDDRQSTTQKPPHTAAGDFALTDLSDVAVDSTGTSSSNPPLTSLGLAQRTEAWNEPDAQIPPKTPETERQSFNHGRLGLLPSPAPTATTFIDGESGPRRASTEQARRRSSALAYGLWRVGLEDQYAGGDKLGPVKSRPESEEQLAMKDGVAEALPTDAESTNAARSRKGSPAKRPQQQRKVSDITTLPSQQRRASESVSRPSSIYAGSPQLGNLSQSKADSFAALITNRNENGMLVPAHSRNISQVSGITDAELVEASPVTIRAAEPTLLQHETTPESQLRWEHAIAEQEAEIERLKGGHSPLQDGALDPVQAAPAQVRRTGGAFASIIASATARKERQKHVEAQPNPYVLSDPGKAAHGNGLESLRRLSSGENWDDARSEVSAEEGAQNDRFHRSTHLSESRRSSVSSIGINAMAPPTGLRTSSGQHGVDLAAVNAAGSVTMSRSESPKSQILQNSSAVAEDLPASPDTVRAPADQTDSSTRPMPSQSVGSGPISTSTNPLQTSPNAGTEARPQLAHARTVSQGLLPGMQSPAKGTSDFQKRFSQRFYARRRDMGERPLSYMALPRDEGGYVKEEINTNATDPSASQEVVGLASDSTALDSARGSPMAVHDTPPAADISALSGPPVGAPLFQQHPLFRNSVVDVQPTQYEKMRSTSRQGGVLTSPGLTDGGDGPNNGPGYFRDAQPLTTNIPGRDVISDNHGLEDVHDWGQTVTTPHDEGSGSMPQEDQKHAKRKSGMWNAFTNRRAPDGANLDIVESVAPLASLENAESANANVTAGEPERTDTVRRGKKTLTKPQRMNSNAVKLSEIEPKKKRFSGLKSLLGRSSTSAGDGGSSSQSREVKTKKLSKMAPAAPTPPRNYQPGNSATVKGSISTYEEYERARKGQMAAYSENTSHVQQQLARAQTEPTQSSAVDLDSTPTGPPVDGWYGPSSQHTHQDGAVRGRQGEGIEQMHDTQQTTDPRRFNRSGSPQGRRLARVPEAFRPVDASFNRPVEPIGPPPEHMPPMRDFGPPARAPSQQQYVRGRQDRSGSNGSLPIMGRSEYYATGQRPFGSAATITPVQQGLSQIQTQGHEPRDRVVSMGTELARSPAKDYQDQQTPFAITLPVDSQPSTREASWSEGRLPSPVHAQQQQPQQYYYADSPPPRTRSSEYQEQYQEQNLVYARPDARHVSGSALPQRPSYGGGDLPGQAYSHDRGAYPSPPYSPQQLQSRYQAPHPRPQASYDWMSRQALIQGQNYSHPAQAPMYQSGIEAGAQANWYPRPQQQQQHHQRDRPVEQHRRYYSQGAPPPQHYPPPPPRPGYGIGGIQQRQFMRGEEGGVDYRRRSSAAGYSGRRDDPAVGEDEVDMIMRGVSYPGQEWDPYSGRY